jgi:hypothetical protein
MKFQHPISSNPSPLALSVKNLEKSVLIHNIILLDLWTFEAQVSYDVDTGMQLTPFNITSIPARPIHFF